MNGFVIRTIEGQEYNKLLVCLTFESIVTYLNEIENAPEMKDFSGCLLIDQLLVTGNGDNRYICCDVLEGTIIISTSKSVCPNESIKTMSIEVFQQYYDYLKYSILTDYQRECIIEGKIF